MTVETERRIVGQSLKGSNPKWAHTFFFLVNQTFCIWLKLYNLWKKKSYKAWQTFTNETSGTFFSWDTLVDLLAESIGSLGLFFLQAHHAVSIPNPLAVWSSTAMSAGKAQSICTDGEQFRPALLKREWKQAASPSAAALGRGKRIMFATISCTVHLCERVYWCTGRDPCALDI